MKKRAVVKIAVIVEFNIIPLGKGISARIFEAKNIEEAFDLVRVTHEAVFKTGVKRVVTTVKIDDRRDVKEGMEEKVKSLKKAIKKT